MNKFFDRTTIIVTVITVLAILIGGFVYVRGALIYTGPDTTSAAATSAHPLPPIGPTQSPNRLIIPKIGVDAAVQDVGLAKSGNMGVPTNYTDVGWYRLGTAPGQIGSAVIDGHVDNGFAKAAVFKHLYELIPGDDMYIQTGSSTQLHFKVEETAAYPVADVPLQKIFNRTDTARLTLITCTGSFDTGKLQYDQRRVVYAVLVP